MTITLPLPEKRLSPNYTVATIGARMAKSAATKRARHAAWVKTRCAFAEDGAAVIGQAKFTGYTLAFFWPDARRRDDDNAQASCKAYRDGIADALGVDDHTLKLAALPTFTIDRANPRLEITLIV